MLDVERVDKSSHVDNIVDHGGNSVDGERPQMPVRSWSGDGNGLTWELILECRQES